MKLSIVIPFYNEAKNVPLVLNAFSALAQKYTDFELLCVNDGSKDDTANALSAALETGQHPYLRIISYSPNGGYGNAILTGVRAATGDCIAWTHSDLQTDPEDVFVAYNRFTELSQQTANTKIIMKGWRIKRSWGQVIFSFGMATIATVILKTKLTEINAQPKVFSKDLVPLLEMAPKDFSLDLYLLCLVKKKGYTIHTIPVEFKSRIHGESSWSSSWKTTRKTIWRTIKYIWRLRKIA